jgi:hypothetical protein
MRSVLFIVAMITSSCSPQRRDYARAHVEPIVFPAAPIVLAEASQDNCPTPSDPDPYEMCIMRDCELHACQMAWAAPEISHRCGLTCLDDWLEHAHCPVVGGKVTAFKICGGQAPPLDACMVFGPPLGSSASKAYCCTDDASPLAVDCTVDNDCPSWGTCQFGVCDSGRCEVRFESDGESCNADSVCFDGACQPLPE